MAAAKKPAPDVSNPLTGAAPNSFTKVTNRDLPAPSLRAQMPAAMPAADQSRMAKAHQAATGPGGVNEGQLGYTRPSSMSPHQFSQVMGAHRMFPNEAAKANGPAINEPHEAHPHVTVQRRAEDLSAPEVAKGVQTLKNYGYGHDPIGELTRVQGQATDRVIGEHAAAGVEESNSQHFYGGAPVTSDVGHMQAEHNAGITAANDRFHAGAQRLLQHPQFQARTAGMTDQERSDHALGTMAQATADTSPNSKWRTAKGWPNMEQAEESATAGLEGRRGTAGKPDAVNGGIKFVTGRVQNHAKAAERVDEMTTTGQGSHAYGDHTTSPKTMAFRGALAQPNSPDAYKVTDVHEAGVVLPGANTSKSKMYRDPTGERKGKIGVFPDEPASASKGLDPIMRNPSTQEPGNARAEQMLSDSRSTVHALNDYATRSALTERGLSRGVNYADNVHHQQAAAWGSQQVRRPDVAVAHADQYPVVRDWGAEGHAELNDVGKHVFGGVNPSHMGPQFRANLNTSGIDKNPAPGTTGKQDVMRNKPYPVMPGDK
jgi:hypothetical protein